MPEYRAVIQVRMTNDRPTVVLRDRKQRVLAEVDCRQWFPMVRAVHLYVHVHHRSTFWRFFKGENKTRVEILGIEKHPPERLI